MDLNLTCNSFERMTDTNKLLYLIYGELIQIRQAIDSANLGSLIREMGQKQTDVQPDPQNVATGLVGVNAEGEGLKCKYCGELIEGNRGNLLAHIRKCPERKKEGV